MALSSMEKGGGNKRERGWGQLHLAHPSGTVLPLKKSAELGMGKVEGRHGLQRRCELLEGGWMFRFVGAKGGNSVGSRFQFCY